MASSILIATPNGAFGELIRQSLGEINCTQVAVARSGAEALKLGSTAAYTLAILDSDLEDTPLTGLSRALRARQPDLQLIFIQPKDAPQETPPGEPAPQAFLTKPFYLPDLLETVSKLLPQAESSLPAEAEENGATPQAADAAPGISTAELTQNLTALQFDAAVYARFIIYEGRVWAYSSQLPHSTVEELAAAIVRHAEAIRTGDLARYVRLSTGLTQYLLYATSLPRQMALGLVFSSSTPFSKARHQSSQAAQTLAKLLSEPAAQPAPVDITPQENEEEEYTLTPEEQEYLRSLPPLIEDIPPPDPDRITAEWFVEESGEPLELPSAESAPVLPEPARVVFPWEEPPASAEVLHLPDELPPDPLADTKPNPRMALSPLTTLAPEPQPELQELPNLRFYCVLIPENPHQYMVGPLAECLSTFLPEFCAENGWQLGHTSLRPQYLLVGLQVTPGITAEAAAALLRKASSDRIFSQVLSLESIGLDLDFWAPDTYILQAETPPTSKQIRTFMQETRQRQGLALDTR